jgi:hypothetical protein
MNKIDPYWISIVGIIAGALIMFGAMSTPGHSNDLASVAGVLTGGMMVSSGMISLAILNVFGKNNNDEKK